MIEKFVDYDNREVQPGEFAPFKENDPVAMKPAAEMILGTIPKKIWDNTVDAIKHIGVKTTIVNKPAVIVILNNNIKGIAMCGKNDLFDADLGFKIALMKATVNTIVADMNLLGKTALPAPKKKKKLKIRF